MNKYLVKVVWDIHSDYDIQHYNTRYGIEAESKLRARDAAYVKWHTEDKVPCFRNLDIIVDVVEANEETMLTKLTNLRL